MTRATASSDPQTELLRLLAESRLRLAHVLRVRREAQSQISRAIQARLAKVQQLRQQIEQQGVGSRPDLEDEYLIALRDLKVLQQTYLLGQVHESPRLLKAIAIAEVLLGVYRDAPTLAKAAVTDLHHFTQLLAQFEHPLADAYRTQLAQLG